MIRDNRQAALDALQEALAAVGARYGEESRLLEDGALSGLFRDLAAEREELSGRVQDQLRALGDMPSMADADRESVTLIGERLRAELHHGDPTVLLERRLADEEKLKRLLAAARETQLPAVAAAVLARADSRLDAGRSRLRAVLSKR